MSLPKGPKVLSAYQAMLGVVLCSCAITSACDNAAAQAKAQDLQQVQAYCRKAGSAMVADSAVVADVASTCTSAGENPNVILTEDFRDHVADLRAKAHKALDDISGLDAPPDCLTVQDDIKRAAEKISDALDLLDSGVRDVNGEEIKKCGELLKESAADMPEVKSEMQRIREKYGLQDAD